MLRPTPASLSRFPSRSSRIITNARKPLVNVSKRPLVQQEVPPLKEPVYLSLTPSLRRGRWDPPAEKSVAILDPHLRQGSANTKTRGEVRGSGAKVRRQKGTGKARLGDAQSPMLRGGGVAFGPKPRDFSTKLPRKVIEMGMRIALSAKLRQERLGVMMRLYWPNSKTKFLFRRIEQLSLRKTLFISGEPEIHEGLKLAIRNIPTVQLASTSDVTVYDILKWDRIILDLKAVQYFEEKLKKKNVPMVAIPLIAAEEAGVELIQPTITAESNQTQLLAQSIQPEVQPVLS